MPLRAKKPLNQRACSAADDAFYKLHEGDDPPSPLFDKDGNRVPLSGTDPTQETLRQQWLEIYKKKDGKVEEVSTNSQPPGEPVQSCGSSQDAVKGCQALFDKFKKEAMDLTDDQGNPIKNGSEVNRRITAAYADMYQRRPDLHWAGAATFVSKQMGCNMRYADQMSDPSVVKQGLGKLDGHDVKALGLSSKTVLVRGNQAIFKDIYPQYRLYETSPQCATTYGKDLHLNPKMVSGFKAYSDGDQTKGMMDHAWYEQNVVLQQQVMEKSDISQDVKNFQQAQDANLERKARWFGQSLPEQVSFSPKCVAPGGSDSPYYFATPPGQFTDQQSRWNTAVPVLDKYDELMQQHPKEMNQAIQDIGTEMKSNTLPKYDLPIYWMP